MADARDMCELHEDRRRPCPWGPATHDICQYRGGRLVLVAACAFHARLFPRAGRVEART